MERINDKLLDKEAFLFGISKTLERTAFYGFKGVIIFYLTKSPLNIGGLDPFNLFVSIMILSRCGGILGGVLGDLLNKNGLLIILGAGFQGIGALIICFPNIILFYSGLVFIVLGTGLYAPNLLSNFGKHYLNRPKSLDSAFMFFYFCSNVGGFLGAFFLVLLGEKFGYQLAIISCGVLFLISAIPLFWIKTKNQMSVIINVSSARARSFLVMGVLVLGGFFWVAYNLGISAFVDVVEEFEPSSKKRWLEEFLQNLDSIAVLTVSVVMMIFWSRYYVLSIKKLGISFIFSIASFLVLIMATKTNFHSYFVVTILFVLLGTIGEVHFTPLVHSYVTKLVNPKYLATVLSLVFLPILIITRLSSFLSSEYFGRGELSLYIGIIILTVAGGIAFFSKLIFVKSANGGSKDVSENILDQQNQ